MISKEGDVDRVCDIYRQIIIIFVQNVATINYAFYWKHGQKNFSLLNDYTNCLLIYIYIYILNCFFLPYAYIQNFVAKYRKNSKIHFKSHVLFTTFYTIRYEKVFILNHFDYNNNRKIIVSRLKFKKCWLRKYLKTKTLQHSWNDTHMSLMSVFTSTFLQLLWHDGQCLLNEQHLL